MRKSPPGDGPGQLSRVCVCEHVINSNTMPDWPGASNIYINFFGYICIFRCIEKEGGNCAFLFGWRATFFVLFYPAPNDNWWTRSHFHCIWWLMRNIVVVDTKTIRPRCPQGVVHIRKKEKIALHLHKYNFRVFFFKRCCTRNHRAAQKTKSSSAREARKCRLVCVDFHKTKQ